MNPSHMPNPWLAPTAVTAYLSATAASISSAIAAVSLRISTRERRTRVEEKRKRDEDERRAQATRVVLYPRVGHGQTAQIVVLNASDLPIYDVTVVSLHTDPGIVDPVAQVLPPKAETAIDARGVVLPFQSRAILSFIDAAGERWHRTADGRLLDGAYVHPADGPLVPWQP